MCGMSVPNEFRVEDALQVAFKYAGFDSGHHKRWVIDQMVRALTGEKYDEWVAKWQHGGVGPNTYEWDGGIAP